MYLDVGTPSYQNLNSKLRDKQTRFNNNDLVERPFRESDHLETTDFRLSKGDHVAKNSFIFKFQNPARVDYSCLGKVGYACSCVRVAQVIWHARNGKE